MGTFGCELMTHILEVAKFSTWMYFIKNIDLLSERIAIPGFDMPSNECFSGKWAVNKYMCIGLKYRTS